MVAKQELKSPAVKAPKPVVFPTVSPEFLDLVRDIYRRYSGQEFADCVAQIRREIASGEFEDLDTLKRRDARHN